MTDIDTADIYANVPTCGGGSAALIHALAHELDTCRAAYTAKSIELATLREGINAAMYPERYNRAQREGNHS